MTLIACKQTFTALKDLDEKKAEVVAYLSTGDVDLTGEILSPAGWDLEAFRLSGVMTYNHATEYGSDVIHRMPIAKAIELWTDDRGLLAHYRFLVDVPGRLGEFAQTLYALAREGALTGHSVMFEPFEWTDGEQKGRREMGDRFPDMPRKGRVYTRQALREGGPVLMPANPAAAAIAVKAFRERGLPVPGFEAPPAPLTDPPTAPAPDPSEQFMAGLRAGLEDVQRDAFYASLRRGLRESFAPLDSITRGR